MRLHPRRLRRGVLPVCVPAGVIGTATVVAPGLALTALHVIAPEDPQRLRLGVGSGCPVVAVESLPITDYGAATDQARVSQRRARQLVGDDVASALGTVDLALLVVPGLVNAPVLQPRTTPVGIGEHLVVPGFPGGHWSISQGPVGAADDADFAVRVLLGPGASGAPALDSENRLAGVVTLDHETGTICVGPTLVTAFLHQLLAVTE